MKSGSIMALAMLIGGIVLLAASVATGEGSVHLVVFIPVFTGSGILGISGIILIAGGIFTFFLTYISEFQVAGPVGGGHRKGRGTDGQMEGSKGTPLEGRVERQSPRARPRVRGGGVVLIGPIPIFLGTDNKALFWVQIMAVVIMVLILFLFIFGIIRI